MKYTSVTVLFIAVTGIVMALWQWLAYPILDDLPYSREVTEADFWTCSGRLIDSLDGLWSSCCDHYAMVNSRLANILAFWALQLPDCVSGVLCGLAGMGMLWGLLKAGGKISGSNAVVAVVLMWLAFPWYDGMSSLDFYINYVWSSAIVLVMFAWMSDVRMCRAWQLAALFSVAVCAGWMHEGIAVCAIGYTFFQSLEERFRRKATLWVLAGLLVGFAIGISGATMSRAAQAMSEDTASVGVLRWCRSMLSQFWPLWVALLMLAVMMVRRRKGARTEILTKILAPAGGLAASVAMAAVLGVLNRAAWGVQLASVILIMRLCSLMRPEFRLPKFVQYAALAVYGLWGVDLLAWQLVFSEEERVMAEQAQVGKDVIIADLTPEQDVPFYLMGMMYHPATCTSDNNYVFARHYMGADGVAVISKNEDKLPGDNPFYINGNLLYTQEDLPDTLALTMHFGPGGRSETPVNALISFLSGRSSGFDADVKVVQSRKPGVYFYELPNRFCQGRKVERADLKN